LIIGFFPVLVETRERKKEEGEREGERERERGREGDGIDNMPVLPCILSVLS
jgi:hypothetical protein